MDDKMIYTFPDTNFNLSQIANSGQCFRWEWVDTGYNHYYEVPIYEYPSKVFTEANEILVDTEAPKVLVDNYFDIDTDYIQIIDEVPANDAFLKQAAEKFSGLRILRQPLWETIVSFIISQNNNIPRIKKSIKAICDQNNGNFPLFLDMVEGKVDLSKCNLGYRQEYIENIVDSPWILPFGSDYQDAMKFYQKFKGVGPKVANCICLYSLHYLEACPIDTWIKKIIDKRYGGQTPDWVYSEYAGVYQQYCFCYERYLERKL